MHFNSTVVTPPNEFKQLMKKIMKSLNRSDTMTPSHNRLGLSRFIWKMAN